MVQALNRSRPIHVRVMIRKLDVGKWKDKLLGNAERSPALSTLSNGLDISFGRRRGGERSYKFSEHNGFSLFDLERTAYDILVDLFHGAPNRESILSAVGKTLKFRQRKEEHEIYRTIDGMKLGQVTMRRMR